MMGAKTKRTHGLDAVCFCGAATSRSKDHRFGFKSLLFPSSYAQRERGGRGNFWTHLSIYIVS